MIKKRASKCLPKTENKEKKERRKLHKPVLLSSVKVGKDIRLGQIREKTNPINK